MPHNSADHPSTNSAMQADSKPPNFLQKLYDFLALDPHPCPEVIYWAADSRQLVIAQPERLAKEILPRLFKHDKLASFGRQLNIYGFSRLFPGRQFKDAEGNVSDASVWAHPTLHRLSTPSELSAIKRRAPPKLMRTRRLANGQVVRTKAGPGVIEKARQVKEAMSKDRSREKTCVAFDAGGGVRPYTVKPLILNTGDDASHSVSASSNESFDVAGLPGGSQATQVSVPATPVTNATTMTALETMLAQTHSPLVSSIESIQPFYQQPQAPLASGTPLPAHIQPTALTSTLTLPPGIGHGLANKLNLLKDRPYVSCPASIHTSPTLNPVRMNLEPFTGSAGGDGACTSELMTPWLFMADTHTHTRPHSRDQQPLTSTWYTSAPVTSGNGSPNDLCKPGFAAQVESALPSTTTATAQKAFPPTFIPLPSSVSTTFNTCIIPCPSATTTRRIAAPAAPVPSHLPQLQPSLNSVTTTTSHSAATDISTNPGSFGRNGHNVHGTFQPSPTEIILSTPQPMFSPLPGPQLDAPLSLPLSLDLSSVEATVPSSFGPTPFCSRDQSTYVSAHWEKEDSWVKMQAAITGRGAFHQHHFPTGGISKDESSSNYCGIGNGKGSNGSMTLVNGQGGQSEKGNGTIDPKWVSPADSLWSTPSQTRVPSPNAAPAQTQAAPAVRNAAMNGWYSARSTCVNDRSATAQPHQSPSHSRSHGYGPPPPFVFYKPSHLDNVVQMEVEESDNEDKAKTMNLPFDTTWRKSEDSPPQPQSQPGLLHQVPSDHVVSAGSLQAMPTSSRFPLFAGSTSKGSSPHTSRECSPLVSLTLPPTPESATHSVTFPQYQVQAQMQDIRSLHQGDGQPQPQPQSQPQAITTGTSSSAGLSEMSSQAATQRSSGVGGMGLCSTFDSGSRWYE
ncbi:hypothetical protein I316_00600 [Kwoniella heveanensis BCC8398]|uniref:HSF-type DNA-binding domain-containing protein n=1 Tax=Kwoniella heveanensis BCC8398 TaxID=1296120 RepID=A0A1B9H2H7_9TREE|nr:hypothetical protein I316_00600 [Kwoniella heveanensis BCC8398]